MNKIILFFVSVLLGIGYEILILTAYAKILPDNLPDDFVLLFLPLIACILTAHYFVIKKKGYLPVVGIFLGFLIGIIFVAFSMWGA